MTVIQLKTKDNKDVPLKNVHMNINVLNQIAQFEIRQSYKNTESTPIEVFYSFPTGGSVSVIDFFARIGDRTIKTILKVKQEAREDYNTAISRGDGAMLMERISGDVFSVSLGNVMPNSELDVIIKYVQELKTEIDATNVRLNVPLTIMPRYTSVVNPTPESVLQGKLVNPPKVNEKPYNLSIGGSIVMTDSIVSIDSKTHKIKMSNMNEKSLNFEINDLDALNEDIVVSIKRGVPKSGSLIQRADTLKLDNEIYRFCTMVNIIPHFEQVAQPTITDAHYTVIIDKSGSMQGADLENCKQGAKIFVLSLPQGSSFDIYAFDDQFEKFTPKNPETAKMEGLQWIDNIRTGGSTEMYGVLADAYKSIKQQGKNGVIVLLSDGGISDTDKVLKLVKQNRSTSCFTVGIGQQVSHALIDGIAEMSNGRAEYVNSGADAVKDKILSQLKRAQSTLRKGQKNNSLKVAVDGPYRMFPETIPTLFEGDVNTFFIFSQNPVKGINYDQVFSHYSQLHNIPILPIENQTYPLHRIAGIKLIDSISSNTTGSQVEHLKTDASKAEITAISLNLGVLSDHTAFIGVEVRENKDKPTEPSVLREIPLQMVKKFAGNESARCYGMVAASCGPMTAMASCGPMPAMASRHAYRAKSAFVLESVSMDCDEEDESADLSPPKKQMITYTPVTTIVKLPAYVRTGTLVTATAAGLFPSTVSLKIGDYIQVTGEGANNGIYKVWNLGSSAEFWVLEKVN